MLKPKLIMTVCSNKWHEIMSLHHSMFCKTESDKEECVLDKHGPTVIKSVESFVFNTLKEARGYKTL